MRWQAKQPLDSTLTTLSGKTADGIIEYLRLGEAAKMEPPQLRSVLMAGFIFTFLMAKNAVAVGAFKRCE